MPRVGWYVYVVWFGIPGVGYGMVGYTLGRVWWGIPRVGYGGVYLG